MNSNNWINDLQAYILTYTGKVYYFNRVNRDALEKNLETVKFIKIWSATIATSDIKLIDNVKTTEESKIEYNRRLWINTI